MAEPSAARTDSISENWYFVVQTKPWSERYAHDFLTNRRPYADATFSVYYPCVMTERRHAGRIDVVERPFLPRTMFVLDDGRGTDQLRSAPGVSSLIRVGGTVARVAQRVVDSIRCREQGGYVQLETGDVVARVYRKHEAVQVRHTVSGQDSYFEAVFHKKVGEERAAVFMRWMGSDRRVVVSIKDLTPA